MKLNDILNENQKPIKIYKLPYKIDGLKPAMSKKSVDFHYNTLTKNYVKKANDTGETFQIAGAFLHNLFWENLQPSIENNTPIEELKEFINNKFGSWTIFKKEFKEKAITIQGSGWCALMKNGTIKQIPNHRKLDNILLILDMWEHSYYLDYGTDKNKYVDQWWKIVNLEVVSSRL